MLSDALRPLTDALEIQETATRLLGEQLGVRAVNYGFVETVHGVDYYVIDCAYVAPGRRSTLGRWPVADFPGFTVALRAGETMAIDEVASAPNLMPRDKAGLASNDVVAYLMAPLVKNERPTAMLCVVEDRPRTWTSAETALVQEVAERTWAAAERARAETALRESDARFHALFDASPVPFMVLAPNPPDFTITAANEAYFAATRTTQATLIGRRLFDVFPDDPRRPGQLGSEALAISLDRVLATRRTDAMERSATTSSHRKGSSHIGGWPPTRHSLMRTARSPRSSTRSTGRPSCITPKRRSGSARSGRPSS